MTLLPFHALISTWGGTTIGPYELWKVWKELLLLVLFVPALVILVQNRELRRRFLQSWIVRICAIYSALHIVISSVTLSDLDATAYGLAINLRIVGFFLISLILFYSIQLSQRALLKVLLLPCAAVLVVGLLQLFVLPSEFFGWFGYEKGVTIAPNMNIDEQPDQVRIMSTLRGPNPLGAYLILPGVLLMALALKNVAWVKKRLKLISAKQFFAATAMFFALLVVMYGTHGRASWIGFAAALGVCLLILLPQKLRLYAVAAGLISVALMGALIYQYRETSFVQNAILHDNPETGAEITSNDAHLEATVQGLQDIAGRPLTGCGPGCAGPASFYNDNGGNLSENYYVQVGQEVGIAGMLLFIALCVLVGIELWKHKSNPLSLALFASLIGIALANLLLHVWADDTLAYIWWGLAGAIIASPSGNQTIKKQPSGAGRDRKAKLSR